MKTNKKKNFILVVLFSFACSRCTLANPIEDTTINKTRTITIASEPDYPPYCIIDKDGKAGGFSIDLFNAAAKAVNLKVEIKIGLWNTIKQDLAEGKIDALPLMGKTPERENLYDFTLPYHSLHGGIFVREGTTAIRSVADLKEKEILVMKGDNAEEFVRRNNISNNIMTTNTFEEAFRKLAAGEGDAVIIQRVIGIQLLKSMAISTVAPLDIPLNEYRQDFCFAVRKGNTELLSRLNEGLSIVIANKTYDDIYLKWFGPELKRRIAIKDVIEIAIYILIPSIIIFSLISIFFLRREVNRRTESLQNEISEHKKTVTSLYNQQLLLKEMERVSKVGGWEYDAATKIVAWTDGVYDIYEVDRSEYDPSSKNGDREFYYPEDREKLDAAFQRALENGESYDLELRLTATKGTSKWIRTSGQAVFEHGKVVRIFGHILDITEQKRTQDELEIKVTERTKELEEKVQKLYKSEKAMLYMVEDLNRMTTEIKLERQKIELTNTELEKRSSELVKSQSALLNVVDDLNIKSEELTRSTNQLEIANKELEAFAYSVSHDLRAPLRHIDGFIEMLQKKIQSILDEQGKRYLDVISSSAKHMGNLIDDLLSFSRMGREEMRKNQVELNKLVREIVQGMEQEAEGRAIQWVVGDLPVVTADPSMLKLVLVNLLSNAQKFTQKKPHARIEIGCRSDSGTEYMFFIRDNGAGFDMRYVDKLFGVFQRLHRQEEFEGTGIGLANVRRIIQRHGGRTWAEGEIDKGATFYFSLPRGSHS
jgi:PAS domain S-box-containing protein